MRLTTLTIAFAVLVISTWIVKENLSKVVDASKMSNVSLKNFLFFTHTFSENKATVGLIFPIIFYL